MCSSVVNFVRSRVTRLASVAHSSASRCPSPVIAYLAAKRDTGWLTAEGTGRKAFKETPRTRTSPATIAEMREAAVVGLQGQERF